MYLDNNIKVIADEGQEELADIIDGLRFLCATPTGKYPMNRDFGIDSSLTDYPINNVRPLLAIEIKEKIERYEPRVEVSDVSFDYNEESGALTPVITLDLLTKGNTTDEDYEEYEEEDDV